jgi:prepilin-type processing-associated H-X9-DG protein
MRQIGIATLNYTVEYSGNLPGTSHHHGSLGSWVYTLADFLDDVDEIRISPGDPRRAALLENKGTSYKFNDFLTPPIVDDLFPEDIPEEDFSNLLKIPRPASTILAFIGSTNPSAVHTSEDHTHARGWINWNRVRSDIAPDRHRVGPPNNDNTRGTSNYLFLDGRVEIIPAEEIRRRINNGENIARPPV